MDDAASFTPAGIDWLASASAFPRSVRALWSLHPGRAVELPCGTVFDVVSAPAMFGRRLLNALCRAGHGGGPVAVHRGRLLLFAAPGTAGRLPTLLRWEEWSGSGARIPALLCHGTGDVVRVPAPGGGGTARHGGGRWVTAPSLRRPALPGPEVLLWGAVRASHAGRERTAEGAIFARRRGGARVFCVSGRR